MQKFRAFLGEMAVHHGGQNLGPPQPAAKADQLRKLLVLQFVHRLLHTVLSAVEFMADVFPFSFVGRFRDRFRVWGNGSAYADTLGQRQNALADFLNRGGILRLDCDESIRYDITKK